MLKYSYVNFSLDILEYCDKDILLKREQYYLDLLNPEYNILKKAGSRLEYKHSEEDRIKKSLAQMGDKNPMYGKHVSEETIKKKVEYYKKNLMTLEASNWISLTNKGLIIKVYGKNQNLVKEFSSIRETAEHFGGGW